MLPGQRGAQKEVCTRVSSCLLPLTVKQPLNNLRLWQFLEQMCYFAVFLFSKGFVFNRIKVIGSCDSAEQMVMLKAYLRRHNLSAKLNVQIWEIYLIESKEMMFRADHYCIKVAVP